MAMKRTLLMFAALAAAAPAGAQTVETGRADWNALPQAPMRHSYAQYIDQNRVTLWTEQVLRSGECKVKGMRPEKFDIDVPYAVLVAPDGKVERILIPEMGCAGLNTIIGSTVMDLVKAGAFKPTGENQAFWYGDRLAFAQE
jgi:hypothetical protein